MKTHPIWNIRSLPETYTCLENPIQTEVAVIGGGITGITTALLLQLNGISCVVLEARRIGQGTTGQSTGNLYELTENSLKDLVKKYDLTTVQKIIDSRKNALNFILANIQQYQIDCDYHDRSMFIFETDEQKDLNEEHKIATQIGLNPKLMTADDFPITFNKGLEFEHQAQINPLTYVQSLARQYHTLGGSIYENSRVLHIEKQENHFVLHTDYASVKAQKIIQATHTPIGLQVQYHTTLAAYREYGIAVKLKNDIYPEGIFWGQFDDRKFSIRTYQSKEEKHLICVGSMHKVGQTDDNKAHILELENFIKKHFDVLEVTHRWGGQNYKPADLLPYIGEKEKNSNQYIATGFSTDGLVYGSLAAMILSDKIIGRENRFADLYEASRHRPIKASKKFISENLNMTKHLIGDFLKSGEDAELESISREEGKLIEYQGNKIAAFRDLEDQFTFLSPICPHMGCTVHWNNAEKTWDCPCHGSRFDTDGKVIEGPAMTGLKGKPEKKQK